MIHFDALVSGYRLTKNCVKKYENRSFHDNFTAYSVNVCVFVKICLSITISLYLKRPIIANDAF